MTPQRIAVKFFTRPGARVDLPDFIDLFHRFIQENLVEGFLVDVADYAHVPDGPGIILVGHDVEYAIDQTGGRPGLLTTRKRTGDIPLAELATDTLRKALGTVCAIEREAPPGLRFETSELEIHIVDQLVAPNDEAAFEAVAKEIEPALREVYGAAKIQVSRVHGDDTRRMLAVAVKAPDAQDAEKLLARLGGARLAPPALAAQSDWDITVEDLKSLRDSGADHVLVDVREPDEYEAENLGGRLIPLGSLATRVAELDRQAHVVVHCQTGGRGARAVTTLREAGFENAWNLRGGLRAWLDRIGPSPSKG